MKIASVTLSLVGILGLSLVGQAIAAERPMTLAETIELATKHNLDVQIERYNPQLAVYSLEGLYGAYDPGISFSGEHSHDEAGSRLLGGGFSIPGSTSDQDTFGLGLGGANGGAGLLPWGMTYSARANVNDTYGDSFSLDNNGNLISDDFESSSGNVGLTLTQPLLKNFWIDSTRLNIRLAKNNVKWTEQAFKQRLMDVVNLTEQTYYELIAARELVIAQQKAVELAERLLAENKKRVEVGAMAPLDEKQAESQAASSRADLLVAKNAVAVREDLLKSYITDEYAKYASVKIVPSEPLRAQRQFFDRQDSWGKGLAYRPDYAQAKIDLENAGIQIKYTKNQLLPQVDIYGTFGYNGSGDEFNQAIGEVRDMDRPFWAYGGQITIPIGNTSAKNSYRASKATREKAALTLRRIEQNVMLQIDDAINQARSSFERVEATAAASSFAAAALDAEEKKLASGKSTSFEVLSLQRDLTTARNAEIRALVDYNKALTQLALAEGTILERRGITVTAK
jgi:outer membrane protein TolC